MDLIQETLLEMLQQAAPRQILCVAGGHTPGLDAFLRNHEDCVVERLTPAAAVDDPGQLGRYEFGLVCGALETLPAEHGSALLARVRDVHCRRLCLIWRLTGPHQTREFWTHERLRSMAMTLHRRVEQDGVVTGIYRYDIDSYNHRREWNNPDKWAHPENFRRYRW